jgi:hypothetical protein
VPQVGQSRMFGGSCRYLWFPGISWF